MSMERDGAPSEGPLLVVRDLRKAYGTGAVPIRALRGVDVDVASGEFVAVTGPSGSGKSTLLNLVAGLERADDGEIRLAGEEVVGRSEDELVRIRRHHVGVVFQFFHLLGSVSALENVALPAMAAGAKRRVAEARARDLLDLLGLGDRARDGPAQLSGGQRQRLAIARAMVNRPTLLLADEPTGALDSAGAADVLALFKRLHDDGQSILLVTHDPSVAGVADRLVHLRDGQVDSLRTGVGQVRQ